jgi:hypothetical protein
MLTSSRPPLSIVSVVSTFACVITLACAQPPGSAGTIPQRHPSSNSDVITREELADPSLVGSTALEAVTRLRPRFVNSRSGTPGGTREQVQISINGGPPMALGELARIELPPVTEIRYLSTADAGLRFGLRGSMGPVLLVTTTAR